MEGCDPEEESFDHVPTSGEVKFPEYSKLFDVLKRFCFSEPEAWNREAQFVVKRIKLKDCAVKSRILRMAMPLPIRDVHVEFDVAFEDLPSVDSY